MLHRTDGATAVKSGMISRGANIKLKSTSICMRDQSCLLLVCLFIPLRICFSMLRCVALSGLLAGTELVAMIKPSAVVRWMFISITPYFSWHLRRRYHQRQHTADQGNSATTILCYPPAIILASSGRTAASQKHRWGQRRKTHSAVISPLTPCSTT